MRETEIAACQKKTKSFSPKQINGESEKEIERERARKRERKREKEKERERKRKRERKKERERSEKTEMKTSFIRPKCPTLILISRSREFTTN